MKKSDLKNFSERVEKAEQINNELKGELTAKDGIIQSQGQKIRELYADLSVSKEIAAAALNDPGAVKRTLEALETIAGKDIPEFPKEMKISNLEDLKNVLDFIAKKDFPKEIAISNAEDLKVKEVKVTGLVANIKVLSVGVKDILKAVKTLGAMTFKAVVTGNVRITNKNPDESIPVRLVDENERFFYRALVAIAGSGGGSSTESSLLQQIINGLSAPTGFGDGSKTVTTAGTRVQLAADQSCRRVHIQAKVGNTGSIYVGGSTVASTRGIELLPLTSITLEVNNLNLIYLDSSVNGEGVIYSYEYQA